jgi:hypothetical protein
VSLRCIRCMFGEICKPVTNCASRVDRLLMTSVYPTYASKQSDYITIEQLVLVVVINVRVNAKVDKCNKA